ncbi:PREDICTED: VAN3-binding protein-like [Camelina sativa]|uniref:VAN3-binding protein-like n=1 Tax=Camelina sativa TaxID=90675 RepID=A0ABM0UWF9_CAMSA|nr:PREDICTED: VAN3-binding protein-like [Camelina sativa]
MTSLHKTLFTQNPTTSLDQLMMCHTGRDNSWKKLENIDEEGPATMMTREVKTALPPETPTETMEFLGRSWSISAVELTKAFFNNSAADTNSFLLSTLVNTNKEDREDEEDSTSMASSRDFLLPQKGNKTSPPITPRTGKEMKHLYKTMGRRLKDQKEKKKQETRTRNAEIHAAVSVAGVAAVVAATAASNAVASAEHAAESTTVAVAVASAAALIASHCIEIAGEIGAGYNQIAAAVSSATNARTNGDVMALTASAATALRGAAILRSRMERNNENKAMLYATKENVELEERNVFGVMTFVSRGEELLKRTRKGDLHWKQVSFNINSNWQVVLKMKSKHVGGTFTKTKKCVVSGVCRDIPEWAHRGRVEKMVERNAYFGVKTVERVIEFECGNKREKQMWIEGTQQLLNSLEIGSSVHWKH